MKKHKLTRHKGTGLAQPYPAVCCSSISACTGQAQPSPAVCCSRRSACTELAQPCPAVCRSSRSACTGLAWSCPAVCRSSRSACTGLAYPCPAVCCSNRSACTGLTVAQAQAQFVAFLPTSNFLDLCVIYCCSISHMPLGADLIHRRERRQNGGRKQVYRFVSLKY